MNLFYDVYVDSNLEFVNKAVEFLEGEFGGPSGNVGWNDELMLWKLSELNPAGRGILVVAVIEGKVVGTASMTRKRMILDGVEIIGGEIGDTYSAEKIRRLAKPNELISTNKDASHYINKSIFGRLVSEIINTASKLELQYIYGTPNHNSLPGYVKKLNFIEIQGYKNVSRSRPTSVFIRNYHPLPKSILKVCVSIITKMSRFYRLLILRVFKPSNLTVQSSFPLDEEIDTLWRSCMPTRGFALVRDSKYYNYRFQDHPIKKYNSHSFYLDGQLACILISCIKKDDSGNDIFVICDYLTNNQINFLYIINYIIDAHSHLPILKYNFWCEKYGKDFFCAFFSGFIGGSSVPIIFFDSTKDSELMRSTLEMDFHLASSDNI